MNITHYIELLINQNCWSVVGGKGTGSIISLGFGDKIKRKRIINNSKLTDCERNYKAEISLMIYCAWRLTKLDNIICSWRDANEDIMSQSILLLRNKKILHVKVDQYTYDLVIYFDDNLSLKLFCDITNDEDSDKNYILLFNKIICTVGLNSQITIESR